MSSDSDSDSLPSLTDVIGYTKPSKDIKPDDIVWAKFKKLYWPALVRRILKKEKKVVIWYTDDPGKSFKLPFSKTYSFFDKEATRKIINEVQEAGIFEVHNRLTAHALRYIERKRKGIKDDPLKYFDQTYPFFLMEQYYEKNPNASKDSPVDIKISPLYLNHETPTKATRKTIKIINCSSSSESEVESVIDDVNDLSNITLEITEECPNASEIDYVNKIIEFVKSGKANQYLQDIILNNVSSDYNNFYEECINSKKSDLNYITYGPFKSMSQMRELIDYLSDLFNHITLDRKLTSFEKGQYVASVWLPEAVLFAISKLNNISLIEAKKVYKTYDSNRVAFKCVSKDNSFENANSYITPSGPQSVSRPRLERSCKNKTQASLYNVSNPKSKPKSKKIPKLLNTASELKSTPKRKNKLSSSKAKSKWNTKKKTPSPRKCTLDKIETEQ